jgi:hypothetical protein
MAAAPENQMATEPGIQAATAPGVQTATGPAPEIPWNPWKWIYRKYATDLPLKNTYTAFI